MKPRNFTEREIEVAARKDFVDYGETIEREGGFKAGVEWVLKKLRDEAKEEAEAKTWTDKM